MVEILELACNASRDNKKSHIIQLHVWLAVRIDEQFNTGGLSGVGRRAAGMAAVAAHGMCPAWPGCVWVHLLRASLSALAALLCRSPGQRPMHSLKGSVRPPRTSLCGKPRRTAVAAGRNHMRIQLLLQTEGRARLVWARASRQRAIGASD